ncbi:MAG: hypothetical protein GX756_01690 [Clostridiales bacterium]|nr:hypothetical protein [Clostridiales bacterium]
MQNDIYYLKKEMDQAHKSLIHSAPDEVNDRILRYIDAKEKYFLALKDV